MLSVSFAIAGLFELTKLSFIDDIQCKVVTDESLPWDTGEPSYER